MPRLARLWDNRCPRFGPLLFPVAQFLIPVVHIQASKLVYAFLSKIASKLIFDALGALNEGQRDLKLHERRRDRELINGFCRWLLSLERERKSYLRL
jgi:hypothetical protein